MGTVLIVLVLLALCGFIAYIGDLLGRRLGKKRLSVFGLRPKHTAILLTVVTGVLIAGITFGAALISIPGFARVVTQGERLYGQNTRLSKQNEQLDAHYLSQKQANQLLEGRNTELQTANEHLHGENGRLGGDNQRLTNQNRGLQADNARLVQQSAALKQSNQQIHAHNAELTQANRTLSGANSKLQAQQARLKREAVGLSKQVGQARKLANSYETTQYAFPIDTQVDTLPFPPDPPLPLLRSTISNLVFAATHDAEQAGARPDSAHGAVFLVPPDHYPPGRDPSASAIEEWVARQVAGRKQQNMAIRVVTTENCIKNHPVPLRLDWYENVLVFRKDEVIATSTIEVSDTEGEGGVLEDLVYFLRTRVERAAIEHNMYPRTEGFGELRYDPLLDVCKQVLARKTSVVVQAVARNDILRSGPLNVELKVLP